MVREKTIIGSGEAQEIQDEILRQMTAGKKLRLACDLTELVLELNQLNRQNGNYRITEKNSGNFRKAGN